MLLRLCCCCSRNICWLLTFLSCTCSLEADVLCDCIVLALLCSESEILGTAASMFPFPFTISRANTSVERGDTPSLLFILFSWLPSPLSSCLTVFFCSWGQQNWPFSEIQIREEAYVLDEGRPPSEPILRHRTHIEKQNLHPNYTGFASESPHPLKSPVHMDFY